MTIVVVQSRLGSTRLPGKGLLPLGGKPVIAHVLETMRLVPADGYYLATDAASYDRLRPVCESLGFTCFQGPENDVLERFCLLAEESGADVIVRATGDNPFLFADAATASLEEFLARKDAGTPCDYLTYTGLPHGSGVEILSAKALLSARTLTDSPYDHEHVGPALYNHQDTFTCIFKPADEKWNHPQLRTTIDTYGDYRRAIRILHQVKDASDRTSAVVAACRMPYIARPVLLVPSTVKGHGTGHLRRCLDIAAKINADIYVPQDASLSEAEPLLAAAALNGFQIVRALPEVSEAEPCPLYSLVVADMFRLEEADARRLRTLGPLAAIDEGGTATDCCDYLLDVIPAVQYVRKPNLQEPSFIPLPENRKGSVPEKCRTALVCIGGEDPAGFTAVAEAACKELGLAVTAVTPEAPVQNLKEKLYEYDLVVTHYGFTAFEAREAGCRVLLLATTPLHKRLSEAQGFICLEKKTLSSVSKAVPAFRQFLEDTACPKAQKVIDALSSKDIASYIEKLASGHLNACPVCRTFAPAPVIARTPEKTYRKCPECGMKYLSWSAVSVSDYGKAYFFEEYQKQYGKTYLEDFDLLRTHGRRRMQIISGIHRKSGVKNLPQKVLDVGCAYGPFLTAAADFGWRCFGTDISEDAVTYVRDNLGFPSVAAAFPNFDETELCAGTFGAVTMWYVIEHFADLDAVLRKAASILEKGGIFAFSTPSGSGVSGRFSPERFYEQSPSDHYSVWDPASCRKILSKYGFRVVKMVCTGHHAERFPGRSPAEKGSFRYSFLTAVSRAFDLGDTFELYCVKDE